jgi:hypothetical protein
MRESAVGQTDRDITAMARKNEKEVRRQPIHCCVKHSRKIRSGGVWSEQQENILPRHRAKRSRKERGKITRVILSVPKTGCSRSAVHADHNRDRPHRHQVPPASLSKHI